MKVHKLLAPAIALSLTVFGLSACSQANDTGAATPESTVTNATETKEASNPITVKNCGKTQEFTSSPKKIVSMGVTGLAYLVAGGASSSIIGRANEYGEEPPKWMGGKAENIKLISNDPLSIEGLVSLSPDLAYGGGFDSASLSPDMVIDKGIPAIVDAPECHYFYPNAQGEESFKAVLDEILQVGKLAGTQEAAQKTVETLQADIKKIREEKLGKGQSVAYAYYFGSDADLFSYGNQGIVGEINNALDLKTAIDPNYHPHQGPLAPEAFVKSDADIIIVLTGMGGATKADSLARLEKIPGYKDMRAVKNQKIYFAESAAAYASPSAIYGLIELADQIRNQG